MIRCPATSMRRLRRVQFLGADRMQRPYLLDLHFVDDPASATTPCPCGNGLG
jgi:hypothetical protein